MSLASDERPLGLMVSSYLARDSFPGYGIYVTDQRILGIGKKTIPGIIMLVTAGTVIILSFLTFFISPKDATIAILMMAVFAVRPFPRGTRLADKLMHENSGGTQLWSGKKDFELTRDQISQIVISPPRKYSPGNFGFRSGHLFIITSNISSNTIRIKILGLDQFSQIATLMRDFCSLDPRLAYVEEKR